MENEQNIASIEEKTAELEAVMSGVDTSKEETTEATPVESVPETAPLSDEAQEAEADRLIDEVVKEDAEAEKVEAAA